MRKFFRQSAYILILPLLGTAIVCADSIRNNARVVSATKVSDVLNVPISSILTNQDQDALSKTLRAHYVRLNANNRLTGLISAIDQAGDVIGISNLEVALVQRSRVVTKTMTTGDGSFLTGPVTPGTYTLCVSGDDGFLAYGIQILEFDEGTEELIPIPDPDDTDSAPRPGGPFSNVSFSGNENENELNNARTVLGRQEGLVQITAAVIPPQFTALQRIMNGFVPAGVEASIGAGSDATRINVEESVVQGGFQVNLDKDGKLVGRVAPLMTQKDEPIRLREMNAFLIQDDEIYARVTIEENGEFEFNDVQGGVYGFAAAGADGFAAMSFEAVEASVDPDNLDVSTPLSGPFVPASAITKHPAGADSLQVAICGPEDLDYIRDKINELNQPAGGPLATGPPPAGVPMGGGFGSTLPGSTLPRSGPGGGGAAQSSIGQWVELGLVAWIISEALNDDDVVRQIAPQPISPFQVR